jgi:hypothetical protein
VGVLTRYSALQLDVLWANNRSSLLFYSLETDPLFLTTINDSNALADSFFLASLATIRSAICFKSFFSIELFLQNNFVRGICPTVDFFDKYTPCGLASRHAKEDCHAFGKECLGCHKTGHFQAVCTQGGSSTLKPEMAGSITICSIIPDDMVELGVFPASSNSNIFIRVLPDSGASIDAIPAAMHRSHFNHVQLIEGGPPGLLFLRLVTSWPRCHSPVDHPSPWPQPSMPYVTFNSLYSPRRPKNNSACYRLSIRIHTC